MKRRPIEAWAVLLPDRRVCAIHVSKEWSDDHCERSGLKAVHLVELTIAEKALIRAAKRAIKQIDPESIGACSEDFCTNTLDDLCNIIYKIKKEGKK